MKSKKPVFVLLVLLLAATAGGPVLARGPHAHVGVFLGGPAFWPGYYSLPPYYYYPPYYPPVVVRPAPPPVYIEQGSPQPAPAPSAQANWWYYCADAQAYYPYVRECPAGWQRVAPQPPS